MASDLFARIGANLDRVFGLAAPPKAPASRRDAFVGSQVNRLTLDWQPGLFAADDELRFSLRKLRARMRDLRRNNPILKKYLRLLANNVVGPRGIRFDARVRDNSGNFNETFNRRIESCWTQFSRSPCLDGKLTMTAFNRLLIKSVGTDGEVLVRKWRGHGPFGLLLEAIDPDQLDETYNLSRDANNNEVTMGVEVDSTGTVVAYHLWDRPQSLTMASSERKRLRIPADQIVHLYDPERMNQRRGWPWAHSVMLPLKMLGGYFEAELIGARIGASAMGFFQRTKESYGTDITASLPEGENTLAMDADPGAFSFLPAGYEIAKWSAEHPNSQFPAFIKAQMRLVALGLGVSYTTLASDLEGVNYSSIRAGILEERDEWRALQEWWIGAFYEPIFAEFLNAALLTGALKLDSRDFRKFLECKWTPRGFQWVDPLKEVQAGILAISIGLASRSGIAAERGDEFEEIVEETADDLAIAALYGVDVTGPPNVKKPTDATDVSNETADTPAGTSTASDDERALTDAEMQVWLRRANAPRIARALQRAGWSKPSTNGHH